MIACIGVSLDDALVFLDVYDATGWRTFAVPMKFAVALFDPSREPSVVFDPRLRGALFHAQDGCFLLLPTSQGERLFKLLGDVATVRTGVFEFLQALTSPVTVSLDDMDAATIKTLVDGFRAERAKHDQQWWMSDEQVSVWHDGKLEVRKMRSRPATLMTTTGMLFAPMAAVEDHPQPSPSAPTSSMLN